MYTYIYIDFKIMVSKKAYYSCYMCRENIRLFIPLQEVSYQC